MADPSFDPFPAPPARPDLLIIAGEHSGDEHAATAVSDLRKRKPDCQISALGGRHLANAGAQLLCDMTSWSIVGLVEVLRHYGFFKRLFAETIGWIETHRPRCVCLVDYPGFNLRLAEELRSRGLSRKGGGSIEVLFYISPQIWAWKAGRRFKMEKTLDALGVIFPFEVDFYRDTSLPTTFLGHPFTHPDFDLGLDYDPDGPILLLPGSREGAVRRILPVLLDGYIQWQSAHQKPDTPVRPAVIRYPGDHIRDVAGPILAAAAQRHTFTQDLIRLQPNTGPQSAAAVLTSSGTMSLKCALAGIPGAIVYRTHPVTFAIGRRIARVRWLGIANILLNRTAWPEFLQSAATPVALANTLHDCLTNPQRLADTRAAATALWTHLGSSPNTPSEARNQSTNVASWLQCHLDRQ